MRALSVLSSQHVLSRPMIESAHEEPFSATALVNEGANRPDDRISGRIFAHQRDLDALLDDLNAIAIPSRDVLDAINTRACDGLDAFAHYAEKCLSTERC